MKIKAFITHKQAEKFSDCQDRFGVNNDTKSIAVSDGMGSTWQQKIWAQILVDKFIESKEWQPTQETIEPLCAEWHKKVEYFIQHLKDTSAPQNLIYRNQRNLDERRSAGATFVGIRFDGDKWAGSVLGDSCLIFWNQEKAEFYTSQSTDAFDSYPDYFDSDAQKIGKGTPKALEGELTEGSLILLVSDPFSEYLLERNKEGNIADSIKLLQGLSSHDEFEKLVEEWRAQGMHNDDTTLVMVEHDKSESFVIDSIDELSYLIQEEGKRQYAAETFVKEPPSEASNKTLETEPKTDAADFEKLFKDCKKEFQRIPKNKKHIMRAIKVVLKKVLAEYYIIKK